MNGGCTRADKIRNETIISDLNIFSINVKIEENKTKWRDHVDRMVGNGLLKKVMNYRPIGKGIWVDLVRSGLMIEAEEEKEEIRHNLIFSYNAWMHLIKLVRAREKVSTMLLAFTEGRAAFIL